MSTSDRLQNLLSLAKEDPANSFIRYGLAMEYTRLNRIQEALQTFQELLEGEPLYVAAYYQMGTLLARCGQIEEARRIYTHGIEAASKKADWHAKSELESALQNL
jgi:tetratricopeptide (TPR) repeat protein